MKTRINRKNGSKMSILGFGCMRLPTKNGNIDEQRSIDLIRSAARAGVNYFDTAYIYHRGKSEVLLGKALAGGLRARVSIATKLPPIKSQQFLGCLLYFLFVTHQFGFKSFPL